jgi:hypothetical protein
MQAGTSGTSKTGGPLFMPCNLQLHLRPGPLVTPTSFAHKGAKRAIKRAESLMKLVG